MKKESSIGPKLIPQLITIVPKIKTLISILELVQFFFKEHHDSPHECSKCHSAIDFKFVYHLNRDLQ
jgi:hypothetical protein